MFDAHSLIYMLKIFKIFLNIHEALGIVFLKHILILSLGKILPGKI